jgi:hypothetical protein
MTESPLPTTDDQIFSIYQDEDGTLSREEFDRHLKAFHLLMVEPFTGTDARRRNHALLKWGRYAHQRGLDDTEAERIFFAFDSVCPLRPPSPKPPTRSPA